MLAKHYSHVQDRNLLKRFQVIDKIQNFLCLGYQVGRLPGRHPTLSLFPMSHSRATSFAHRERLLFSRFHTKPITTTFAGVS